MWACLVIQPPFGGVPDAHGQPEQVVVALQQRQDSSDPITGRRPLYQLRKGMPRHRLHLRTSTAAS